MFLQSLNRYYFYVIFSSIIQPVLFSLLLLLVFKWWGSVSLHHAVQLWFLGLIFICITSLWWAARCFPRAKLFQVVPINCYREWMGLGVELMLTVMIFSFKLSIVLLLLRFTGNNAQTIAVLTAIYVISASMWISGSACSSVLTELIAPAAAVQDTQRLQKLSTIGNTVMFSCGVVLFLVFVFYGKIFLHHFGASYVVGYYPLLIAAGGNLVGLLVGMAVNLLEYAINAKLAMKINMWGTLLVILVGIGLCYFWGLYGAAWTFVFMEVLFAVVDGFVVHKKLGIAPAIFF